jgi:transposase
MTKGKGRGTYRRITDELRETIINGLASGTHSTKEIADLLKLPRSTVSSIYNKFPKEGVMKKHARGGRKSKKLGEEGIASIQRWLAKDCALTLRELQAKVHRIYRLLISLTTISSYISAFNLTLKRVHTIAAASTTPERLEARKKYCEWFLEASDSRNIIYLDETGFQISMRRQYGRAPAGQRAVQVVPAIKTTNRTVMAAMSKEGLIYYKGLEGPGDRVRMLQYLEELFVALDAAARERVILIMDNAAFHRCAEIEIRAAIESRGHELAFLPPYSPFFNPIEYMFSQWKSLVRRTAPRSEAELMNTIDSFTGVVTRDHCRNYCNHVVTNAVRCLAGRLVYDQ